MKFSRPDADIFIPSGIPVNKALARTTHLCLAAHQDDIEIFAYEGISECFRSEEKWFTGVVVTNGGGSPRAGVYKNCTDRDMQDIRKLEQRKAAYLGEYSAQIQLAHPSASVKDPKNPDVRDDLVKLLKTMRPDVVYLHNPADKHDTHIAVLLRCLEAIRTLPVKKRPKKAYGCEVWRDLDWMLDEDKKALRVDRYPNLAHALIAVFDSQIDGKRYDLATIGRRQANATYSSSHTVDASQALTWAMDLTPLLKDDTLSLATYTTQMIERFRNDVEKRIKQFGNG